MIHKKREELITFLRSQLIGPGGCNNQFKTANDSEFTLASPNESIEKGEVLNTTPGSIYSSAILFPLQAKEKTESEDQLTQVSEDGNSTDAEDQANLDDDTDVENAANTETEDSRGFDRDEDIDSLARRFPNRFGISCCLLNHKDSDDLKIKVTGRYYLKIKDLMSIRIKVDDVIGMKSFLDNSKTIEYLGSIAHIEDGYLKPSQNIKSEYKSKTSTQLKTLRTNLRELNKYFCAEVAKNQDGTVCNIFSDISFKPEYRYLSAYKERLFAALNHFDIQGNYTAAGQIDYIKKKIANIEKYETYISYIEDILAIFDDRAFGYWQSYYFSKDIDLSNIDLCSKRVFRADEHPVLKDIVKIKVNETHDVYLSLDAWLQVIQDGNRLYLKVLLINKSTPVSASSGNRDKIFSIVTESVNERSFFGVSVDISSSNLTEYHTNNELDVDDKEATKLRFLYRTINDYGVGHLCSVNWGLIDGIMHVWSEFMPMVETPDVEPIPRDKSQLVEKSGKLYAKPYLEENPECLQFKWLSIFSDATNDEILLGLKKFLESYKVWISKLDNSHEIARQNISQCEADYNRMLHNVVDFLSEPQKMLAFRTMNAAMFMQLWHNTADNKSFVRNNQVDTTFDFYKKDADDTTIFTGIHAAWRPFQLAFILLNLDGIFRRDPSKEWTERNDLVDLVWFPTGGGKTEAYLGIIALTIINRRYEYGMEGNGTAAIMRYTLRLLTTQQFQRALRMIMALEQIRRWNLHSLKLGDTEISIGLYVGAASLPNKEADLVEETKNWANTHGKIPLDKCPWCGEEIVPITIKKEQHFKCKNMHCTFGRRSSFPVRLCDEQIYVTPPTLLFGTVDKFAQLAHKVDADAAKDSRRLFSSDGCLPPDLIIQDELHLLLGPLGSAVALYECAIDQLCSRVDSNGFTIRPKIISSTATTRNTSLQIRALYDRAVSIFPKNGVDYDDSFFAFYKRHKNSRVEDWHYEAKRKYVGILPTGRTQMTTQIRLASILFVHRAMFELENYDKLTEKEFVTASDYYYSIISYFNSLKEVGKTDAQFYQEFTKYTRRLFKRVLRYSNMLECFYAYNDHFRKSELTGRLSGEEAVRELAIAQNRSWDPTKRLPFSDDNGNWHRPILPADMILATNMISVGLDVARFNTIIMNSMPRNIAEYIQASSRVARERDGLVLTLHNPYNQRDVSHFEKFREFHEKLYYYVEPISITPFSPKSIERFLPLYLATIIRHRYSNLGSRKDATNLNQTIANKLKSDLITYFKNREKKGRTLSTPESDLLTSDMLSIISNQINKNIDIWLQAANVKGQNLVYYVSGYARRSASEYALFASPEDYEGDAPSDKWLVPNALRVIEPESVIHVIH